MPVFSKALKSKTARNERMKPAKDDAEIEGPVADEGEDLMEVDSDALEEASSLDDDSELSMDEEEEEDDEEDEDQEIGDDDESAVAAEQANGGEAVEEEEDTEATAAVNVEFSEPKAWAERMTLSASKPLPEGLNPNDDPKREEVFMNHALLSARRGIAMLEKAGIKWRRPDDYYAEMYKTDMHMDKIKSAMERTRKEVQERAHRRNMREQKKFGKEVQADVIRERAKAKNEQMAKLSEWRKQKGKRGSLNSMLEDDGDDNGALPVKGGDKKARRDAFRKPGKGGAGASNARRSLRPGGAGKKGGSKRPGKSRRR